MMYSKNFNAAAGIQKTKAAEKYHEFRRRFKREYLDKCVPFEDFYYVLTELDSKDQIWEQGCICNGKEINVYYKLPYDEIAEHDGKENYAEVMLDSPEGREYYFYDVCGVNFKLNSLDDLDSQETEFER